MTSKRQRLTAETDPPDECFNEEYLDDENDGIDYEPEEFASESESSSRPLEEPQLEQSQVGFSRDKIPPGLFGCWLVVSVRNFKGHTSGKEEGRWGVAGRSLEEFICNSWNIASKFLKREICFSSDSDNPSVPFWSEKTSPDEGDFSKFAIFSDKSAKKNIRPDQLTDVILQSWRTKEIHLLLHVYSTAVSSKAVFQNVQDTLFTKGKGSIDRSGAASNSTIDGISKKLREIHDCWEAHDVAWTMWANSISVSEPHLQEELICDAPPMHLAKLFRAKEAPQIQAINRNFSMAHNVNHGFQDDIAAVRRNYDQLENMLLNGMKAMKLMKKNIESLEMRAALGDSFITAAEQAVLVEETDFSASLADKVTDCEDIDHM